MGTNFGHVYVNNQTTTDDDAVWTAPTLQSKLDGKQDQDAYLDDIAGLTDPGDDRILFWDNSDSAFEWLDLGTNLSVSGNSLSAAHALDSHTDVNASGASDGDLLRYDGSNWVDTTDLSWDGSKLSLSTTSANIVLNDDVRLQRSNADEFRIDNNGKGNDFVSEVWADSTSAAKFNVVSDTNTVLQFQADSGGQGIIRTVSEPLSLTAGGGNLDIEASSGALNIDSSGETVVNTNFKIGGSTDTGYITGYPGSPSTDNVLYWDGSKATFTALNLNQLGDVNASSPSDGDHLEWDDGNSEWIAAAPSGGSSQNLYESFTDGTNTTTADSTTDTFKFRSSGSTLSLTVTEDDATHGDNLNLDVVGSFPNRFNTDGNAAQGSSNQLSIEGSGATTTSGSGSTVTVSSTDKQVRVSSNDTTSDYLINKLTAGTGITLTEKSDGSDEDLEISSSGGSDTYHMDALSDWGPDSEHYRDVPSNVTVSTASWQTTFNTGDPPTVDSRYWRLSLNDQNGSGTRWTSEGTNISQRVGQLAGYTTVNLHIVARYQSSAPNDFKLWVAEGNTTTSLSSASKTLTSSFAHYNFNVTPSNLNGSSEHALQVGYSVQTDPGNRPNVDVEALYLELEP